MLSRRAVSRSVGLHRSGRLFSAAVSSPSSSDHDDSSLNMTSLNQLFNPTEEHKALRSMLQTFVEREVRKKRDDLRSRPAIEEPPNLFLFVKFFWTFSGRATSIGVQQEGNIQSRIIPKVG
jgi:hypothetical protein